MDWFLENLEIARESRLNELDDDDEIGNEREIKLFERVEQQALELHKIGFVASLDDFGHAGEELNVCVHHPDYANVEGLTRSYRTYFVHQSFNHRAGKNICWPFLILLKNICIYVQKYTSTNNIVTVSWNDDKHLTCYVEFEASKTKQALNTEPSENDTLVSKVVFANDALIFYNKQGNEVKMLIDKECADILKENNFVEFTENDVWAAQHASFRVV